MLVTILLACLSLGVAGRVLQVLPHHTLVSVKNWQLSDILELHELVFKLNCAYVEVSPCCQPQV